MLTIVFVIVRVCFFPLLLLLFCWGNGEKFHYTFHSFFTFNLFIEKAYWMRSFPEYFLHFFFSSIISECLNWMSARVSTNNRKHFRVITTKYETELFRNVFCCCVRFLSFWVQLSIFWLLCFSNKKMVNAWSGGCWSGNTCFMSLLLSQKSTDGFHDLDYFRYRTEMNKSGIKPFEVFASGSFQLKRIKFTT